MFKDAAVLGDPILPSFEELILVDISLNAPEVYYLCDMLIERVEPGIPLGMLDLRTCVAGTKRAVQLLSEIVVDVYAPVKKESGDLSGRRWGSAGALGEEEGFARVVPFLGSWDFGGSDDAYHRFKYADYRIYSSDDDSDSDSSFYD